MINRFLTRVVLVCLFTVAGASAEDSCQSLETDLMSLPDNDIRALVLGRLVRAGCLGGTEDDWPLAATLEDELRALRSEAVGVRRNSQLAWLREIGAQVARYRSDARAPGPAGAFDQLSDRLDTLASELAASPEDPPELADPASWIPSQDLTVSAAPVSVKSTFIDTPCAGSESACVAALASAMDWLRLVKATERVLSLPVLVTEQDLAQRLARDDRRWESYFTEARPQLPWELALNAWLYERRQERYCQVAGGFCSPPDSQLILLHPGVSLEYLESNPAGNRLEPALMVELIGFNRWRWQGASMQRPFGASLVALASDRADSDILGYGLMLHFNHRLSFGVTRHGDETGAMLSYQLLEVSADRVSRLRNRFTGGD